MKLYTMNPDKDSPDYNASGLLDVVMGRLELKSDAKLAAALGVAPPVISKIRSKILALGPSMMLRIHEAADMPIKEIRAYLGISLP